MLGIPLSLLYKAFVNFSMDDGPTVTVSNSAIAVNVAGILLAFPIACLSVAYLSAPKKPAPETVTETEAIAHKDDSSVWPPSPKTGPSDEG